MVSNPLFIGLDSWRYHLASSFITSLEPSRSGSLVPLAAWSFLEEISPLENPFLLTLGFTSP